MQFRRTAAIRLLLASATLNASLTSNPADSMVGQLVRLPV
jgi:hypothetical protein